VTHRPRIALVGNLANVAYQTCKFLRRKGVEADVFVNQTELNRQTSNPENLDFGILENPPDWLKIVSRVSEPVGIWTRLPQRKLRGAGLTILFKVRLLLKLREYDLIVSFCCAPWFIQKVRRPYVSFATGSDLRELALENSPRGRHARSIFQHAQIVFFGADPGQLAAVRQLKLNNSYPYRVLIDTDFYAPDEKRHRPTNAEELLIFHPSHLDWTYQGADRWTKGNDKLFRAFARFVRAGHTAKLIYLERGPDIEPTRRLVKELGIEGQVEARTGDMSRAQLRHYFNLADIVADQFTIGLGHSGLEAMSCGRPVLVRSDVETMGLFYEEIPPVLSCETEDEIYSQLESVLDHEFRKGIGQQARQWIMKYHNWEIVVNRLIWHLETVLGQRLL
jgi:glycosyltransferase involved in cell wall biosynthesis